MKWRQSIRNLVEVFTVFLRLGLTSFGGPVAHLGYFRQELIENRGWLSEAQYAQLVAICQFLPGPASSQVGFCLGLFRAGILGALAAFIGFTLPSAFLLFVFASQLPELTHPLSIAAMHGLKLVAVAVVAHAITGMLRQLCPDPQRMSIAALSTILILITQQTWLQLMVIPLGAFLGLTFCKPDSLHADQSLPVRYSATSGLVLLGLFLVIFFALPTLGLFSPYFAIGEAFYVPGSLVFGGGHVVLPLLQDAVVQPGWISIEAFLNGYGAAQAVPGPLFTIATYLGTLIPQGYGGLVGASIATLMIFLPGFLLVCAVLPLWHKLSHRPKTAQAVCGINAAVVGLLAAAFYDPIWTTSIHAPADLAISLFGFTLLSVWRISAFFVVISCVLASLAAHLVPLL